MNMKKNYKVFQPDDLKRIGMTTSGGIVQNIRRALIILELEKTKKHSCPKCGDGTNDDDGDDNKDKNDDGDARIYEV